MGYRKVIHVLLCLVLLVPFSAYSTPLAQNIYQTTVVEPNGTISEDNQVWTTYNGDPITTDILTPTQWATVSMNAGLSSLGFSDPNNPSILTKALSSSEPIDLTLNSSFAFGALQYAFAVIAPDGGLADVPIEISGIVDQWITGDAYAAATASVFGTGGAVVTSSGGYGGGDTQYFWCDGLSGAACIFSYTFSLDAKSYSADQILTQSDLASGFISLQAQANTNPIGHPCLSSVYGCTANGYAQSYIDPYIYIDPTFLAANPGYSIEVSYGLTNNPPQNISAVPEPSTYAMLLAGLGLVGFTARRRQEHTA